MAQLLQGLEDEPLEAESILFVDADGAGLAAIACAMFEQAARDEGCPELRAGFASAGEPVPAPEPKAVKAAAKYGLDISKQMCIRDSFGGLREHIWLFGDALMKKLMILDGNSVVNRAFYGVWPLNAPDGTPTNAVYGLSLIHI